MTMAVVEELDCPRLSDGGLSAATITPTRLLAR
jgi:hypothetical protein